MVSEIWNIDTPVWNIVAQESKILPQVAKIDHVISTSAFEISDQKF